MKLSWNGTLTRTRCSKLVTDQREQKILPVNHIV